MLKIWGRSNSLNVQKVMWTVGELGIAHERLDVGGRFGGLDRPAYLGMNPNAKIPTIDDDGVIVGILENVPTLNDAPRTVGCPSSWVLETNAGWSRRHGVRAGQKMKLPRQPA